MSKESRDTKPVSTSEQAFQDLLGTLGEAADMITAPSGSIRVLPPSGDTGLTQSPIGIDYRGIGTIDLIHSMIRSE